MPAYRYVPGLQAHPREARHGGSGLHPEDPPDFAVLRGLELLAHRFPWAAHEAFEHAWLAFRATGDPRAEVAAGLAKVAAAWLRTHAAHERAARRLLARAAEQLEGHPEHAELLTVSRRFVDTGVWPVP